MPMWGMWGGRTPANESCVGRAPSPAEPSPDKESSPEKQSDVGRASPLAVPLSAKETHVARTPSSAKESCVVATLPEPQPEALSPAKETHVARTPSSAKESCAAPTPPEPQPKAPSPATQPVPASNVPTSSLPSATRTARFAKSSARNSPRSEGRLARRKNTI